MSRSTFLAMDPYFNEVCEAYFAQTNGNRLYPTISELASLYFGVDELTAVAYLLGAEQAGADCMLDEATFNRKPGEMCAKPSLKLQDPEDIPLQAEIVANLPKREQKELSPKRKDRASSADVAIKTKRGEGIERRNKAEAKKKDNSESPNLLKLLKNNDSDDINRSSDYIDISADNAKMKKVKSFNK